MIEAMKANLFCSCDLFWMLEAKFIETYQPVQKASMESFEVIKADIINAFLLSALWQCYIYHWDVSFLQYVIYECNILSYTWI